MKRAKVLQESKNMRFEEVYARQQAGQLAQEEMAEMCSAGSSRSWLDQFRVALAARRERGVTGHRGRTSLPHAYVIYILDECGFSTIQRRPRQTSPSTGFR